MKNIAILLTLCIVSGPCKAMSQRRIYTLFTDTKTWNEASAICESQFGQLVKIQGQGHLEELAHLDSTEWEYHISNAVALWSGLHQPFSNNNTWEYQDCETISADISYVRVFSGGKCASFNSTYALSESNCSTENIFVCQRYEGDCWYEPFIGETFTAPIYQTVTLSVGLEASDCALSCRSDVLSPDIECWGFIYDPSGLQGCQLLYLNEVSASSTFLTTGMTASTDPDMIFYVRRCFEGTLDTRTYNTFQNNDQDPETECTYTPYTGNAAATDVCFCPTQDQPPIPEPITSEEKAQQYIKELTIDASNTSAANNKLNSAEDNRPSAVGVGFVGVGLLTAVFGGLVLMDLNLLYAGIKELFTSVAETQSSTGPNESEC